MNFHILKFPYCLLLLFAIGWTDTPSVAFSSKIHSNVCNLTWKRLDSPTKKWLISVLDKKSSFRTACQWPDWIRKKPEYKPTAKWHYQDYQDDDIRTNSSVQHECHENTGCLLIALRRNLAALIDNTADNPLKTKDLRPDQILGFIGHLVVDLHQPLHLGRHEDYGGNSVYVQWRGKRISIHKLLDSQLYKGMKNWEKSIEITSKSMITPTIEDIDLEIQNWLKESRLIAAKTIYPTLQHDTSLRLAQAEPIQKLMVNLLALSVVRLEAVLKFAYEQRKKRKGTK